MKHIYNRIKKEAFRLVFLCELSANGKSEACGHAGEVVGVVGVSRIVGAVEVEK